MSQYTLGTGRTFIPDSTPNDPLPCSTSSFSYDPIYAMGINALPCCSAVSVESCQSPSARHESFDLSRASSKPSSSTIRSTNLVTSTMLHNLAAVSAAAHQEFLKVPFNSMRDANMALYMSLDASGSTTTARDLKPVENSREVAARVRNPTPVLAAASL